MDITARDTPYAIAMWDYSWLERRNDGGGYADWDRALDELVERGYDAVRIDAYPHLVAAEPRGTHRLAPAFEACDWGSRDVIDVQVLPALVEFVAKCADRDVAVALSTWFRIDEGNSRMAIESPADLAAIWRETLGYLANADLLEAICWVDLCNEFPLGAWAPFFEPGDDDYAPERHRPAAQQWIETSIDGVREAYPDVAYCVSETAGPGAPWGRTPAASMDLIELHLWLMNTTSFYRWERYDEPLDSEAHFQWFAETGAHRYRDDAEHWQAELETVIQTAADWSRRTGLPLATTEGWGPIHFRDDPALEWDWVKEICAFATRRAADTGRWAAIATSNFCGPQFTSMWDDVEWHRELTDDITSASVDL